MNKRFIAVPIVAAAIGIAAFAYFRLQPQSDPNVIRVSGNIEVNDVEVSFRTPGWVEARPVSEGETIKTGDLVARLESAELKQEAAARQADVGAYQAELAVLQSGSRPEEIAQADANVTQAAARLEELVTGSRPQEIATARAAVSSAEAEVARLASELKRQRELFERKVISDQQYEKTMAEHEVARARLKEAQERLKLVEEGPRKEQIDYARAVLAEAQEKLSLVRKGPREEEIARARAQLDRAKQTLAIAETRLSYAALHAPIPGIVLSENVEAGEYVVPGVPVVTIGNLAEVWLRAYVNETDLGRVKLGQRVCVTTDTFPGKAYPGALSFIASQAEFTPKSVQTQKERVKLVYRVKIDIPNPQMELKPGMPADADIWIGEGAPPCLR